MNTDEVSMREARQRPEYEIVRRIERGEAIRAVARTMGVSRKLVRKVMLRIAARRQVGDDALDQPPKQVRTPRSSKLDEPAEKIAAWVKEYPDIRAMWLWEKLQAEGFDGGYTVVRHYLNAIRPKAPGRTFREVRTGPGQQCQMDWSPYKIGKGESISAFSILLSHSRYQFMRFTSDQTQKTLFTLMRESFEHFGGVPAEVVTDSMPGVVDRWELDRPVLNLRAIDFAAYNGFSWHIAPRANGAYKGYASHCTSSVGFVLVRTSRSLAVTPLCL